MLIMDSDIKTAHAVPFGGLVKMNIWEIIAGVIMLVLSLIIIATTIAQPPKQQDMSSAVTGSSGNFYSKNGGTTREDSLSALTKYSAILFFIITLAANIVGMIAK